MAPAEVNTGNTFLDEKVEEWMSWDQNESTRFEIDSLMKRKDRNQLERLLLSRMEFGTAGLRGQMGAGYSQMNDLVIIQTTQGFAKYLRQANPTVQQLGVVVGYDGRHNSRRFAELAVAAFIGQGIPVYLYSKMCPTPFVPFAINEFKLAAGVMVTASHNPKEDNGYKVYWGNGAQIIPPHDKGIQQCILENLQPWDTAWKISNIAEHLLVKDPLPHVMKSYYRGVSKNIVYRKTNSDTPLTFTFSAMHGVAYPYMVEAFKVAGLQPFIAVEEQKDPDPEFSTVKFPNPEEGKSALDLSFRTAELNGSTIILANDPDADRLAVAERLPSGEWHVFNGNQIGSLLGWWAVQCYKQDHITVDNCYMIASTVSSKILRAIGQKEGFKFEETLTGFKWMGNRSYELIKKGKEVLFAFEEAIGFMWGTLVLDKDGIQAAVKVAEMAAYLELQGLTLRQKLDELYVEYGYHVCNNSYYLCYEPTIVKRIFEKLRNFNNKPQTYPMQILKGKYKVTGVRDLTTGYDSSQPDNKALLPVSRSSQMITFTFENGLVATLRTSGTEPKVKYYTELCAKPELDDWAALDDELEEMILAIVEEFLQPRENGLISRST